MALYNETYAIHGMQQDNSPKLPSNEYSFENFNIRFSTEGPNSKIVIKPEKGNQMAKFMIINSMDGHISDSRPVMTDFLPFIILGACVVDKYIVVFGKDGGSGKDYIVRLEKHNNTSNEVIFRCIYLFDGTVDLGFDFSHNIETHPYVETELQKKVYFCDGVNFIRCINVVNPQCINNLGLLNIGRHLALNEQLTVTKKPGVFGSIPGGKLQIAFAYGTDIESMTPIVDYSALYDCVFENAGVNPEDNPETSFADHTFEVRIDNVDPSFEWIFIYIIHRTSLEMPPVIYVKNFHINSNSVVYTINLGETDIYQSNKTLSELLDYNSIIPLTIQPYENRMFAGNIKIINDRLPQFDDNDITGEYYLKTVGHEYLRNHTYNYNPSDNVFAGSSYDNKGFRKGNWYKFGIIGQYEHGEWTDVMSVTTKQCDRHSLVEINQNDPDEIDISNVKYRFDFNGTQSVYDKLMYLKSIGIKKIKPVCVYPNDSEKTIISQGIVNPTIYRGKNRRSINGNSPFAQPSWFFRPVKLFNDRETFFQDHSPYTMRDVEDLAYPRNYIDFKEHVQYLSPPPYTLNWFIEQVNGGAVDAFYSNPEYINKLDSYCHWNENLREFRHGMSLPTKDRINAECEFSEISGYDFAYTDEIDRSFSKIDEYCISYESPSGTKSGEIFLDHSLFLSSNFTFSLRDRNQDHSVNTLTTLRPNIISHGYDNMIFVDTSICTFNSPEIDYYLIEGLGSSNINISSPEYTMYISGLAQINGSLSGIQIAPTTTIDMMQNASDVEYLAGAETVQGTCISNTKLSEVPGVREFLFRRNSKGNTQSPFCYTSGPFWFDKLLVLGFTGKDSGSTINDPPYKDDKIYTAYPKYSTSDSYIGGIYRGFLFSGRYLIGLLLGFDPAMVDQTLATAFCFAAATSAGQHRRVKRAPFESVSQMVQSYYGELCHRYDNDDDTNKRDTLIAGGKIFFGKFDKLQITDSDLNGVHPLIYTEATDIQNNYIAMGDMPNASNGIYYTSGAALTNRITAFSNLGISFETLSDKSYFNWNYLDVYDSMNPFTINVDFWKNLFLLKESDSNNWQSISGGRLEDIYASDIATKNESGGGNLCYFFGWWSRPRQGSSLHYDNQYGGCGYFWNNTEYTSGQLSPNPLIIMTYPYTLPSSEMVWPVNKKDRRLTPSIYGSHYYAPFSTDFPNALFDPYYAHVIYPIMHTNNNIPFCGTSSIYKTEADSRPIYNYTSSVLYSNVTNYFDKDIKFNTENHFINEDFEYITIPYLGDHHSLQKYGTDENDIIKYDTVSLTAATKWYRGWRNVLTDGREGDYSMISKGWTEDTYEFSIFGNLVFSGYLPQLFTKSGYVTFGNHTKDFCTNGNYYTEVNGFRSGAGGASQICTLDYLSSPHIVFCDKSVDRVKTIIPGRAPALNSKSKFDFYYKDFVSNVQIRESYIPNTQLSVDNYHNSGDDVIYLEEPGSYSPLARYKRNVVSRQGYIDWYFPGLSWACSNYIYPHTGNWVPITKEIAPDTHTGLTAFEGSITQYPYWMRKNTINNIQEIQTSYYIPTGVSDQLKNSYNLCIADYINTSYESASPYTDNIEFYSWLPCGDSMLLDDIIARVEYDMSRTPTQFVPKATVNYLEGDTYTTRYNCLKTVLPGDPVDLQIKNGISECASVYIESYINLDGRFNNHEALYNDADFSYIMNGTLEQVSKINPVYSQKNNLFSYFEKNENYQSTRIEHFPTMVQWTPAKTYGALFDTFGTFPSSNAFYSDGTQGEIRKLITSPSNRVLDFQEHGISVLDINPQALLATDASIIEINAASSTVLTRASYLDRTYGCQNKWTVTNAVDGVYFMDNQKKIIGKVTENQVNHISSLLGFESWAKNNLNIMNDVWEAGSYNEPIQMSNSNKNKLGFVSYYDPYYSDIYFINKEQCLALNPSLSSFTSFYSYNNVPYIVNSLDKTYSFVTSTSGKTNMYCQYYTYNHTFYDNKRGYYIDLLVNPYPLYDKVYNFISYDNECYDENGTFLRANGYNKLTVTNYRQTGVLNFNRTNTRIKFRTWRTEFPRETGSRMNRIRGTWCRVKFEHTDSGLIDGTNNLYNIAINFSILEQPMVASSEDKDK